MDFDTLNRFLIEGDEGAILHTGDFRAEPRFIESMTQNRFLRPYLASESNPSPTSSNIEMKKTLETIYLDTASLLSHVDAPSKVRKFDYKLLHPLICLLDRNARRQG